MNGVPVSQIPNAPFKPEEPPLSLLQAPTYYSTGVAQTLLTPPMDPPPSYNPQPLSAWPPDWAARIASLAAADPSPQQAPNPNASVLSPAEASLLSPQPPYLLRPTPMLDDPQRSDLSVPADSGQEEQPISLNRGRISLDLENSGQEPLFNLPTVTIDPIAEGVTLSDGESDYGVPAIDYDGSPTAYMPGDTGADQLSHGVRGANYFGFVKDSFNSEEGYVSKSGFQRGPNNRQSSYIDARRVPYIAVSGRYFETGGRYGDFARIRNPQTGKAIWVIVADSRGTKKERKNGGEKEISIAAARQLGIEFNRSGTTKNDKRIEIQYFKGSRSGRWY